MLRRHRLFLSIIGLGMLGASAVAAADGAVTLKVRDAAPWGPFLVDQDGRTLYAFSLDSGRNDESACVDECADAWPPLIAEGEVTAGEGARADLISTFPRPDGGQQVAYRGWPLYYYYADDKQGEVEGQSVEDYGGPWRIVAPNGVLKDREVEPTPSQQVEGQSDRETYDILNGD